MASPRETAHIVITETVEDGDFNPGKPLDRDTIATQALLVRHHAMEAFLPEGVESIRRFIYVGDEAWIVEVSRNELGITGKDEKKQPTRSVVRGDTQITRWSYEEGGRTNTDKALEQVKSDLQTVLLNVALPRQPARIH